MIYLDHAATTPPDPAVVRAMAEAMTGAWANPSALYGVAGTARRALRTARQTLADMLNAPYQEIVFTSGGGEGNALAMTVAAGGHAVVSAIEHTSVLSAARQWAASVTLVPPGPDGRVSPEAVERALRRDTKLISVQLANNETGVIQPVGAIGTLARARRIPFHCDAVQAFGQIPVDVQAMHIDLLTLSAHKFYGPRGAGALYARQGVPLRPLIPGGGQEQGLRGGTENVAAVVGMGVAAGLARDDMDERAERERALLAEFVRRVETGFPGARLLCSDAPRLPGIAAILLPGMDAERAIARLDMRGIAVSGGAACAARDRTASHVYRAVGLSETQARQVIRVSIGRHTTREEMGSAAEAVCFLSIS